MRETGGFNGVVNFTYRLLHNKENSGDLKNLNYENAKRLLIRNYIEVTAGSINYIGDIFANSEVKLKFEDNEKETIELVKNNWPKLNFSNTMKFLPK